MSELEDKVAKALERFMDHEGTMIHWWVAEQAKEAARVVMEIIEEDATMKAPDPRE